MNNYGIICEVNTNNTLGVVRDIFFKSRNRIDKKSFLLELEKLF